MREFAEFKQKAMRLSSRIGLSHCSLTGCMGFFSSFSPNLSRELNIIQSVAKSFNECNDPLLRQHCDGLNGARIDLDQFKIKVLTGAYLLVWSSYTSFFSKHINQSLIACFQDDLETTFFEMSEETFSSSLNALSQYSAFIYSYRAENGEYRSLNQQFGESIQADIENVRALRSDVGSDWSTLYSGVLCTLGLTKSP